MQQLIERIRDEAVHVGDGIVKVDGFLNHRVDAALMSNIGDEFARRINERVGSSAISSVLTVEVSGIPPAMSTASSLDVPMVYARKHRSRQTTDEYWVSEAKSRTKGHLRPIMISHNYLHSGDRVVIIDDFLATGNTVYALAKLVRESGATLVAIGVVIEKPAEKGRESLADFNVPIWSLARIKIDETGELAVTGDTQ